MALTTQDIARLALHDDATAERVKMIAKVQRKRVERQRTIQRRNERWGKYVTQGRI